MLDDIDIWYLNMNTMMQPPLNVVFSKEDRISCSKTTSTINNQRNKIVLEEEEYVSILSSIIERDYFPNLNILNANSSLQCTENVTEDKIRHLSIDMFLNDYTSYDNDSFEDLQKKTMEEHRRKYHWLYEQDGMKNGMLMLYYIGDKILTVEERAKMDYILNHGLYGMNTSEYDNKMIGDDRPNNVDPWKFRIRNQLMFPPELKDSEDTCGMNDFQQQQHEDEDNNKHITNSKIKSILPNSNSNKPLLLENGRHKIQNAFQYAISTYNNRVSMTSSMNNRRNEKIIQRHNTSFQSVPLSTTVIDEQNRNTKFLRRLSNLLRLEEPHTPSLVSTTSSSATSDIDTNEFLPYCHRTSTANHIRQKKEYQTIAMTPIIEPGSSSSSGIKALSPLFTWGNLENSPMMLLNDREMLIQSTQSNDSLHHNNIANRHEEYLKNLQTQAYLDNQNGIPFFTVNSHSKRELLGRNLDSKQNSKAFKRKKNIYSINEVDKGSNNNSSNHADNESQLSIKRSYYNSFSTSVHTNTTTTNTNKYQNNSINKNNNNNNKMILSSAQRFQNLTPAAKSLALKLNKK